MVILCCLAVSLLVADTGAQPASEAPPDAPAQPTPASTEPVAKQPATQPSAPQAPAQPTERADKPGKPDDKALLAEPDELVAVKWKAILTILQNEKLDQKAKEHAIGEAVFPAFDFPLMARLALGARHWSQLTAEQRQRYVKLFVERLRRAYREKIAGYEGEKLAIDTPRKTDEEDDKAAADRPERPTLRDVPIQLVVDDRRVDIVHRFRKTGERWLVYDVRIEGVSMVSTYRSQFNDVLRAHGVEVLLKRLEEDPAE